MEDGLRWLVGVRRFISPKQLVQMIAFGSSITLFLFISQLSTVSSFQILNNIKGNNQFFVLEMHNFLSVSVGNILKHNIAISKTNTGSDIERCNSIFSCLKSYVSHHVFMCAKVTK